MLQVIDDFLWLLRREGFAVSTPQVLDAIQAVRLVGFEDHTVVREALACVVAPSRPDRARLFALFDAFFALEPTFQSGITRDPPSSQAPRTEQEPRDERESSGAPATAMWMSDGLPALAGKGFRPIEIEILQGLFSELEEDEPMAALRRLVCGGASLAHRFAMASIRLREGVQLGPLRAGLRAVQVSEAIGIRQARSALGAVADRLEEAVGIDRSRILMQILRNEIDSMDDAIKAWVDRTAARDTQAASPTNAVTKDQDHREDTAEHAFQPPFRAEDISKTAFEKLTPEQSLRVQATVRLLAERLRGAARVRRRHARRSGRLDLAKTFRSLFRTGGVPFQPVRRKRIRARPKLVVLCDVSDSVRQAAAFMLEFVRAVAELFEHTRVFVFISDLREVTAQFRRRATSQALQSSMNAVDGRQNTSHARAFAAFEAKYAQAVDRRTTLVILGDARTNYGPTGEATLEQIRRRAREVLWLCSEPSSSWGLGDSAIAHFAAHVDRVLPAGCADDLERAARHLCRGTSMRRDARTRRLRSAG